MTLYEDHHCAVFVRGPNNQTVLVYDRRKSSPRFWKFPGGKRKPGETPLETAVREYKEETGLTLSPENLMLEDSYVRDKHMRYFYTASIDTFDGFNKYNNYDVAAIFAIDELRKMVDLHPTYRDFFIKVGSA